MSEVNADLNSGGASSASEAAAPLPPLPTSNGTLNPGATNEEAAKGEAAATEKTLNPTSTAPPAAAQPKAPASRPGTGKAPAKDSPKGKDAKKPAKGGKDAKGATGDAKADALAQQQAAEIEGLKTSVAEKDNALKALNEEIEQQKLARNKAELEQGQLSDEIARYQTIIAELKVANETKDGEARSMVESHAQVVEFLKGQNKQILHSHEVLTTDLVAKYMNLLQIGQKEHLEERAGLSAQQGAMREEMQKLQLRLASDLADVSAKSARETIAAREKLEQEAMSLSLAFDQRVQQIQEEHERQKATEMAKLEEQRTLQTTESRKLHDKQISELKRFYKDVVGSNSSTILSLKEENDRLRTSLDGLGVSLKEAKARAVATEAELRKTKNDLEAALALKGRR